MGIGRDYGYFAYTSDDTNQYAVKIAKAYGNNAALGFGAYNAALPLMPRGMQMRGVNLMDPTSKAKRRVPVGAVDSDVWDGTATTVTVPFEGDADGLAMDVQSSFPEKPATRVHVITNF